MIRSRARIAGILADQPYDDLRGESILRRVPICREQQLYGVDPDLFQVVLAAETRVV